MANCTGFRERFAAAVECCRQVHAAVAATKGNARVVLWAQDNLEGGSEKHKTDIRGILEVSGDTLDKTVLDEWIRRLGVTAQWAEVAGDLS